MDYCKIEKLEIKNFKTFSSVKFNFNEKINILTGVNNSGKTTVLEAIALWNECFCKLIKPVQRADEKLGIVKGQYRLGNKINYFDYNDIVSVRSPNYEDIFYNLDILNKIILKATIKKGESYIDISFQISKSSGSNYEIKLIEDDNFTYNKFNELFEKFPLPINTIFASPISNILLNEEFKTEPVIKDNIAKRESIKVIRNRLYNLSDDVFLEFEKVISFILGSEIKLNTSADKKRDIKLDYNIQLNSKDISKNLSLVGSGTLQIIEILLSIFDEKKDLNIVLLDEPDSHIHRDIQKRLIKVLIEHTPNTQIFLTTHNESLIRSSKPEFIFHLESNTEKEYFPIIFNNNESIEKGLQPTKQIKILQSLGSESALDFINALEADRLLFVEGKTDPLYIDMIINKKYYDKQYNIMYWSFEGIDNIFKHILSYKELFSCIKNKKTLWEKSALIFDRDYFTDKQALNLEKELSKKLEIPVYIWNFYTLEAVLLTDLAKFTNLLFDFIKSKQIECNKDDIKRYLDSEINRIIDSKKNFFNEKKGEIIKWIDNRRANLEDNRLPRNILPDEIAFSDIEKFHLSQLNSGNLSSLANKDDIHEIIKSVLSNYKIDDITFSDIINVININSYFDEWSSMINKIFLKNL
ncbi:MAG: AAA family ATPase [Campylobacterales bacterium]|nr:AAA family ATPase [Campylobacterales bacterium]